MNSPPHLQRCLIVDDNHTFIAAASRVLSAQGLPVIGAAHSSAEALVRLRELQPDVVLIDVSMGEDDGFELAERLHGNGWDAETAVVLISTHTEQDFTDLIARSPAVGFLTKTNLSAIAIRQLCAHGSASGKSNRPLGER